jgi:hypothetical protein
LKPIRRRSTGMERIQKGASEEVLAVSSGRAEVNLSRSTGFPPCPT